VIAHYKSQYQDNHSFLLLSHDDFVLLFVLTAVEQEETQSLRFCSFLPLLIPPHTPFVMFFWQWGGVEKHQFG
jgi:hypothetical protein